MHSDCRMNATHRVHNRQFGIFDLSSGCLATQLSHGLNNTENGPAGVRVRKKPPVRAHGQLASDLDAATLHECTALAAAAKSSALKLRQNHPGEVVVRIKDVSIGRGDTSHAKRDTCGLCVWCCRECRRLAHVLVRRRRAGAEQVDGLLFEVACSVRRGNDECGSAIGDKCTVQRAERVSDQL